MNTPLSLKQRIGKWLIPRLPITRFLFDQVRTEVNAARVRFRNAVRPTHRRRLAAVRKLSGAYVNVACGPHILESFANLDLFANNPEVIPWDCRRGLPFRDGSVAGIRVEHFVEHLEPRQELPAFLASCYRALIPGGILRVIVPDAEGFLRAYCRDDLGGFRDLAVPEPFPEDLPTRMDIVNHVFHQWHEHRWGYDFETLAHRLQTAGFGRIERTAFEFSLDPVLAVDRAQHAPYSLYVDAVRIGH